MFPGDLERLKIKAKGSSITSDLFFQTTKLLISGRRMKFVYNILWYVSVEPGGPTKEAVCGKQEVETDTINRHMWKGHSV